MRTYLTSGIAALIISAGFAGAAAAQDSDYLYNPQGQPTANPQNLDDNNNVDTMSTGSIDGRGMTWLNNSGSDTNIDGSQDSGDYYDGVLRPQD